MGMIINNSLNRISYQCKKILFLNNSFMNLERFHEIRTNSLKHCHLKNKTFAVICCKITSATISSNSSASIFLLITKAFASFVKMYILLLILRVLLAWFPTFNWDIQPWIYLRRIRVASEIHILIFSGA